MGRVSTPPWWHLIATPTAKVASLISTKIVLENSDARLHRARSDAAQGALEAQRRQKLRDGFEGPAVSRLARGVIPEQADDPLNPTRRRLLVRTPTEDTQAHLDLDLAMLTQRPWRKGVFVYLCVLDCDVADVVSMVAQESLESLFVLGEIFKTKNCIGTMECNFECIGLRGYRYTDGALLGGTIILVGTEAY
ncbi:hypothetical protein MUK42_11836 [Musa troglodytarum]|uniref:Uncharacterized protein n=1 Tax=Musa troglodytarum TaxID=320322 RepID=A0A9E7GKQ6_9LILI|nr:hypothetical protein MUK42_11836 [Musa troglodytarum]